VKTVCRNYAADIAMGTVVNPKPTTATHVLPMLVRRQLLRRLLLRRPQLPVRELSLRAEVPESDRTRSTTMRTGNPPTHRVFRGGGRGPKAV
jgi:hypothetical protein